MHVHTRLSIDATGNHCDFLRQAIAVNLDGVGFSEHWDFDPNDPSTENFDYQAQAEAISDMQSSFQDVNVLHGVEISYEAERKEEIREALNGKTHDFLIGSLHSAGNVILEFLDPENISSTPDEIYIPYFNDYLKMVRSGMFHIAGHLDYPKKYCFRKFGPLDIWRYEKEIDEILKSMIDSDMLPELNSAGFNWEIGEQYPSANILSRYRNLGGRNVTFGSDAHSPAAVGAKFDRLQTIALSIGLVPVIIVEGKIREWK